MKKGLFLIVALFVCVSLVVVFNKKVSESSITPTSANSRIPTSPTDNFPKNNIRMIVAYSAGGSSDKLARMLQPYLEKELGVSVVVENMGGASGEVAATNLMRGKADGYTILAVNAPGIYYTIEMQNAIYSAEDLYPIWVESYDPIVLLTLSTSPWSSLSDFIEDAKTNPGKRTIGVAAGGGQQAIALWLQKTLQLDVNIVNYDGGSGASAALLGGHVNAIFGDAYARIDLVKDAKCLGIASERGNYAWRDAVSFNKQLQSYGVALPEKEFQSRYGCYWVQSKLLTDYPGRAETLIEALERAAKNPDYIQLLKDAGVYESMVLEPGPHYANQFNAAYQVVVKEVAPLFKSIK